MRSFHLASLSTLTSRATHAHPTSPRSTGFCAIWDCISSSSSSQEGLRAPVGRRLGYKRCFNRSKWRALSSTPSCPCVRSSSRHAAKKLCSLASLRTSSHFFQLYETARLLWGDGGGQASVDGHGQHFDGAIELVFAKALAQGIGDVFHRPIPFVLRSAGNRLRHQGKLFERIQRLLYRFLSYGRR